MTKEERLKIYSALSAPFPENTWNRTDGRVTGRGYSTTGIGYQHIVDRLNEVLGVGGFRVQRRLTTKEGTSAKGRPSFDATCELELQLGEWQAGAFVPFAQVLGDGCHSAVSLGDAIKGAFTNAFKKTAAFAGVGREVYAGALDGPDFERMYRPEDEHVVPTERRLDLPGSEATSKATSKQLSALRAIAARLQLTEKDLRQRSGIALHDLSRSRASALIEELNQSASFDALKLTATGR